MKSLEKVLAKSQTPLPELCQKLIENKDLSTTTMKLKPN